MSPWCFHCGKGRFWTVPRSRQTLLCCWNLSSKKLVNSQICSEMKWNSSALSLLAGTVRSTVWVCTHALTSPPLRWLAAWWEGSCSDFRWHFPVGLIVTYLLSPIRKRANHFEDSSTLIYPPRSLHASSKVSLVWPHQFFLWPFSTKVFQSHFVFRPLAICYFTSAAGQN